jgi:hypothetical protein
MASAVKEFGLREQQVRAGGGVEKEKIVQKAPGPQDILVTKYVMVSGLVSGSCKIAKVK